MRRFLVLTVAAALAAGAGCSDSEPPSQAVPATAPPGATETTSTGAGTDTSSDPGSDPDPEVTTTGSGAPDGASDLGEAPVLDTGTAAGAGCSPGGDTLPDGWWFGAQEGPVAGGALELDLQCFFVGEAAVAAATEDGVDPDDITGDVYLRNQSTTLRTLAVSPDATAQCLATSGGAEHVACDPSEVLGGPVWLRVVDGQVDRLLQQFFP